jgi:adenylate cyclase
MVAKTYTDLKPMNDRVKISVVLTIVLTLTVLPCLYLIGFVLPNTQNTQVDDLGQLIAQQLSSSSAEPVVHKDTLSLSVVLRELISSGVVVHAAIYSADNQLLAEAGATPETTSSEFHDYMENITVQDSLAGHVRVTIRTNVLSMAGIYSASQWMWIILAWTFFLLLIAIVWITSLLHSSNKVANANEPTIGVLQQILQTLNPAHHSAPTNQPEHVAEHSHWHIVRSGVLVLEFSNLSMLLQRLNNKTMAKLVDECYANMEMCAKLYNGNLSGWLGKNVVICFNGSNDETEHYFHAICCAELIIGLTNYLNERLAKSNLPRIKLHAALHAGDLLTDVDYLLIEAPKHMISEAVSIATEICQHAEHNQLLISDDLYTSDAIAQRLIISDPHVIVLECINRPMTTYAILDLQPTYRELLTRQIQQLITLKSA